MINTPSPVRLWTAAGLLIAAFAMLHGVGRGEIVVPHTPLRELPYALDSWTGTDQPVEEQIVRAVGVDDYVNRVYLRPQVGFVQLYIGYYASQRTGDTIHSPKNCLPGSGWDPLQSSYSKVSVSEGREIEVNAYVIQRGLDKQMVFYWYQSRGRVIASEYSGKFWMVADAISRHRTDGALVRLVTPMNDGEIPARERLVSFTQLLFPHLESIIPN